MPPPKRLSDAIADCLALREPRLAPSTYADEAGTMRRLLAHTGDIQCRHLKPGQDEAWGNAAADRPSPASPLKPTVTGNV